MIPRLTEARDFAREVVAWVAFASGVTAAIIMALTFLIATGNAAEARDVCTYDNNGRVNCMASAGPTQYGRSHKKRQVRHVARHKFDANGNRVIAIVKSRSGVSVRVSPNAHTALQCVVDYVEAAGVRIKAMRGYGPGTVRASLHPSGRALDINQTDRDITIPHVPRLVSNAAADKCGVISGARWGYADNGHWNLAVHGRVTQEPWPRVLR